MLKYLHKNNFKLYKTNKLNHLRIKFNNQHMKLLYHIIIKKYIKSVKEIQSLFY